MSFSLLAAPKTLSGLHTIYVEVDRTVGDEICNAVSHDARIAGFVVRDKTSRDRLLHYEREVLDLSEFSRQEPSYSLSESAVLVDRSVLRNEGGESAEHVHKVIDELIAAYKQVILSGDVLFSLCFRSIPTRAEVSDVFHMCRRGVAGFVLSSEIARRDSLAEGITQLAEVLGVFENEWKK